MMRGSFPFLQKDPRTASGDPEIQAWIESITASKGYLNAAQSMRPAGSG
jgi:hypothetical protein